MDTNGTLGTIEIGIVFFTIAPFFISWIRKKISTIKKERIRAAVNDDEKGYRYRPYSNFEGFGSVLSGSINRFDKASVTVTSLQQQINHQTQQWQSTVDPQRIQNNPARCPHIWQEIPTLARTVRICGLCNTVEESDRHELSIHSVCEHEFGIDTVKRNNRGQYAAVSTCKKCGKNRPRIVEQPLVSERRGARCRSIIYDE